MLKCNRYVLLFELFFPLSLYYINLIFVCIANCQIAFAKQSLSGSPLAFGHVGKGMNQQLTTI